MATHRSWPSIQRYGLLTSSQLAELFEIPENRKAELLATQRKQSIEINHTKYGSATLRDQKPLSPKSLERCLTDCNPEQWYRILNDRVFFWLSPERLKTLMSASEYVGQPHTILHVDTAALLARHQSRVELAHMNTGNTRPFAHPRGRSTFRSLAEYPYETRSALKDYSAIVELTVAGGVSDIRDLVIRVEHAAFRNGSYEVEELILGK